MSSKDKRVHILDPKTNVVAYLLPLTPPATPSPPSSASSSLSLIELRAFLPSAIERLAVVSVHNALSYGNQLCFNAALPMQYSNLPAPAFPSVAHAGVFQLNPIFHHSLDFLAEPATSPPLPSLTLTCDPSLPWRFEVRRSLPNRFVTVYDVLQTLSAKLRTPVSGTEMIVFITEETFDSIVEAFELRVNTISDIHEREEQRAKFVRRIDCLMGRTRLLGLQWVGAEHPDMFTIGWGWP
jgi:hypothetical protein